MHCSTPLVMVCAAAAAAVAGCNGNGINIPSIADESPGLTSPEVQDGVNVFRARAQNLSGWQTTVFVRFTRHFWPGPPQAHEGVAAAVAGQPDVFEFVLPDDVTQTIRANDTMFHQWFVEYSLPGGSDIAYAESALVRRVANCTDAFSAQALAGDQTPLVAQFDVERPHQDLPLEFRIQPHGWVCLRNGGVGFARSTAAFDVLTNANPTLGQPQLLLYMPRPRREDETDDQYHQAITDENPDPPYRLIGWAYGKTFNPDERPRMQGACIPSDKWFVHEAGYHLFPSGDMDVRPPEEDVRGSALAPLLPPVDLGAGGVYHPRFWDLHVWRNDNGPPTVSIDPPFEVPGLVLPDGTFFVAETFE